VRWLGRGFLLSKSLHVIGGLAAGDFAFVALTWVASRAVVFAAMLSSGHANAPAWNVLANWDGAWYQHIATSGYEYNADGKQHAVAFFPLYPVAAGLLMRVTGLPFAVSGALLNNLAFFGALIVIFGWVRERCDSPTARWTVATLCIVPASLFVSVAYSEGLFMLFSAWALRSFDRGDYTGAGIAAALASATRFFGVCLFPAFLLDGILRRRRGPAAFVCASCALLGPIGFSIYCGLAFRDPLAFANVEGAWRHGLGPSFGDWEYIVAYGVTWAWMYQLAIGLVGIWWYRLRHSVDPVASAFVLFLLTLAEFNVWGKEQLVFLFVGLGCALVVTSRKTIGVAAATYGLAGLGLIVFSGSPYSAERLAYALVPVTFGLAILWRRFPAAGAATLTAMIAALPPQVLAFAHGIWVD
jgi:hypothetical protein